MKISINNGYFHSFLAAVISAAGRFCSASFAWHTEIDRSSARSSLAAPGCTWRWLWPWSYGGFGCLRALTFIASVLRPQSFLAFCRLIWLPGDFGLLLLLAFDDLAALLAGLFPQDCRRQRSYCGDRAYWRSLPFCRKQTLARPTVKAGSCAYRPAACAVWSKPASRPVFLGSMRLKDQGAAGRAGRGHSWRGIVAYHEGEASSRRQAFRAAHIHGRARQE